MPSNILARITLEEMKCELYTSGIPGELIDAVLYHLNDDRVSLLACTLVSSSWCSFARCHLLHIVVCRPNIPHLSPRSLSTFLCSIPDVIPHIHSLKIIGSRSVDSRSEVAVEDVVPLLSALPKLKSLSFERLALIAGARLHDPPIEASPLPGSEPLTINLCAIGYTDSTHSFFRALKDCLGSKPIRASLRFVIRDDHFSFPAFLDILGPNIIQLSCNLLGYVGQLSVLIAATDREEQLYEQKLDSHVDAPPCTSVTDLDLYLTGSGVTDPDTQLFVLGAQILAFGELVKFLSPNAPIRHITLRFQRFGPHTRATERMLNQMLVPNTWFQFIGCLRQLLLQFRHLETLTCVLCDDGLEEQYGDYLPAIPLPTTVSSVAEVISREEEYAFYESFVRRSFPEFVAMGVLQVRRA